MFLQREGNIIILSSTHTIGTADALVSSLLSFEPCMLTELLALTLSIVSLNKSKLGIDVRVTWMVSMCI